MSFNCQQNLSHYFNDAPPFSPSFTKSSPPTILPHHQEQHGKLSPGKFCLSPAPSPTSLLNASKAASGTKLAPGTFSDRHDDDDNQPLDLSIHPNRDDQSLKRSLADEHKPQCMVKSCTYSVSSPQSLHLSRCSNTGQVVIRSPNPGMAMSSLSSTDSPFSSQYQSPNSSYSSSAAFLNYNPQPSPWTAVESSSFQHLTTSDSVLNGAHTPSSLFRPYDDHVDMNIHPHEQQQSSLPNQHVEAVGSDDDEPTYMDLDSATTRPLNTKARNEYSRSLNHMYGKPNISQPSTTQNRRTEDRMEALHSPHQSTLVQALNRGINFNSTKVKSTACFVGGVISHTSLERNQKVCTSPTNVSQSSQHVIHQKLHTEQQMYFSHSSSALSNEALPTGLPTYHSMQPSTPQTTLFQPRSTIGNSYNSPATVGSIYSKVTSLEPQPQSVIALQLKQPWSKRLVDQSSISGSKNNILRDAPSSTTNSFQLPVSKRTSISPNGIIGSQQRRARQPDINASKLQAESADNETCTKISLLDFWISKILMERSSEAHAQSKPCNVDYICTANGEKKIRLRLVDLMELQVEQSLKA